MYITYNGLTSTGLGIEKVMRVTRPLKVEGTERWLSIPGRDGVWDFGRDLNHGNIITRMYFSGTTFSNKREMSRQIAAWLNQNKARQLIFSDEPDKYYMARPTGVTNPEEIGMRAWYDVLWMLPEPVAFSMETKSVSPNNGTTATPCVITATMTQSSQSLRVNCGDKFVLIQDSANYPLDLQEGDIVTIDTGRHLVLINGIDARPAVSVSSEYFLLPPGSFEITSEPTAQVSIEYRERWT